MLSVVTSVYPLGANFIFGNGLNLIVNLDLRRKVRMQRKNILCNILN